MNNAISIGQGDWQARVCPRLGANVIKLTHKGQDVLVPLKEEAQLAVNPYLQGAPILLPANRTAGGQFTFEGIPYTLEVNEPRTGAHLHGFVHRQPFTLLTKQPDRVTLQYENTGSIYPFPFRLTVEYSAGPEGFTQRYTLANTGAGRMPFIFCLHTTFVEPESFSVPIDACQHKDHKHIPLGGYIPLDPQEQRYATGSPSKGIPISGYYRGIGHQARVGDYLYTVSEQFDHWILFNGLGEMGLLCVEPQWGAVNGLNTENGCPILEKGQQVTLTTTISHR